jgi:hypothetical protein
VVGVKGVAQTETVGETADPDSDSPVVGGSTKAMNTAKPSTCKNTTALYMATTLTHSLGVMASEQPTLIAYSSQERGSLIKVITNAPSIFMKRLRGSSRSSQFILATNSRRPVESGPPIWITAAATHIDATLVTADGIFRDAPRLRLA